MDAYLYIWLRTFPFNFLVIFLRLSWLVSSGLCPDRTLQVLCQHTKVVGFAGGSWLTACDLIILLGACKHGVVIYHIHKMDVSDGDSGMRRED